MSTVMSEFLQEIDGEHDTNPLQVAEGIALFCRPARVNRTDRLTSDALKRASTAFHTATNLLMNGRLERH